MQHSKIEAPNKASQPFGLAVVALPCVWRFKHLLDSPQHPRLRVWGPGAGETPGNLRLREDEKSTEEPRRD